MKGHEREKEEEVKKRKGGRERGGEDVTEGDREE